MSWINHLPPACWSTFWKSHLKKKKLGSRFDIMDNKSYFYCVCVLTYAIIYVLIHQIIFRFYLLKYFFIFSSTFVLTSSIDVVVILSIWRLCTVYKYWITICYITLTTVSIVTSGLSLFNTLRHERISTVFNTTYSIAFSRQKILMTMSLKLVLKGLQGTNNQHYDRHSPSRHVITSSSDKKDLWSTLRH